jgi:hypothetical protein
MKYTLEQIEPKMYQGTQSKDNYGNLKWEIILKGEDGKMTTLNKSFKDKPEVGKVLEGKIVTKEYNGNSYLAFEQEKSSFGGYGGKSPEQQASIVRQHSQEMALMYCQLKGKTDVTFKELQIVIDWFEADTKGIKAEKTQDNAPQSQTTVSANDDEPPVPNDDEINVDELPF